MRLIETGLKRGKEAGMRMVRRGTEIIRNMGTRGYDELADTFLNDAELEWYIYNRVHPYAKRPFEVQFEPWRFNIDGKSSEQIGLISTRELFVAFRGMRPPSSDDAYFYQCLNPRSGQLDTVSYYTATARFGITQDIGILRQGSQARVVLFPIGYNHTIGYTIEGINIAQEELSREAGYNERIPLSSKGEFPKAYGSIVKIGLNDIDKDLLIDPNPKRRFRLVVGEEDKVSHWEAVAA